LPDIEIHDEIYILLLSDFHSMAMLIAGCYTENGFVWLPTAAKAWIADDLELFIKPVSS